jgi:hypothetical protein
MRRIETKTETLPAGVRRNAAKVRQVANFTPVLDLAIIKRAEAQAVRDGFPYFRDLIVVLLALYGNGSLSQRLGRELPKMIRAWVGREDPSAGRKVVKRNLKLRRDVYERAVDRWASDSAGLTATSMLAFLLESYADGEIEFALRRGKSSEAD